MALGSVVTWAALGCGDLAVVRGGIAMIVVPAGELFIFGLGGCGQDEVRDEA